MENYCNTGMILSPPDERDYDIKKALPAGGGGILLHEYKLPDLPMVYNQAPYPNCVPYASRRGIELAAVNHGKEFKQISHSFINLNREIVLPDGKTWKAWIRSTDGYCFRDVLEAGRLTGFATREAYPIGNQYLNWKRLIQRPTTKDTVRLTPAVYADAAKRKIIKYWRVYGADEIKRTILETGNPVLIAAKVYQNFFGYTNVNNYAIVVPPKPKLLGSHGYLVTGWRDSRNAFIIVNSWGEKWGYKGRGFQDYEYPIQEAWGFTLDYEGTVLG